MSLLLCRQEYAKRPLYVEELGIHLYTSQELSYVIYHYPLLVMDGFVDEHLLSFLRDELNQGFLALKVERWIKAGEDPDEALVQILQECDYYNSGEIGKFKQQLAQLRKLHPAQYRKQKADELFSMRQYARAEKVYEELLELPMDSTVNDSFLGKVWESLGACRARQFRFGAAYDAYEKAYLKTSRPAVLERMYGLTQLDESVKLGDRIKALVTPEQMESWSRKTKEAREHAAQADALVQVEQLFKKDSIRRQAGEAQLLQRWKQEYRRQFS